MGWGDDYLKKTGESNASSWGDDYANYKVKKANEQPYKMTDAEKQNLQKSAYSRQWNAFRNELYPALQSSINAWKAQGGTDTDFDWEGAIGNILAQEKYLDVAKNFKRPKDEEPPAGYDLVAAMIGANKKENPNLFTPEDLITEYRNLTYRPAPIDPDRATYSQANAQEQQERQRISAIDMQATADRIRELEALKQQTAKQTTIQPHGKALPANPPGSEYDGEIAQLTRDYGNAQRLKTLAGYDALRNEAGYKAFSGVPEVQFKGNRTREMYNYINDLGGVRAEYNSRKYRPLGFMQTDHYEGYQYISADEKKLYNYLLSTKGEDEAAKYLKALEPDLNTRFKNDLEADMGKFTKDVPVGSDIASVGIGFAKPQGEIYSLIAGLKGEQIDPNSPYFGPSIAQGSIRGTRSEQIKEGVGGFGGDALAFMYQTGMSLADFAAALPLGEAGALTLMGMNAATDATRDIVQRGGTNKQAIMGGLLAGAAEVVFEKVSIDSLVKMANPAMRSAFIKNVLKQASIEASEETLTEIANTISDGVVMGDLSNYNVAVKTYMQQGMTEADAKAKAIGDIAANIGLAAAGGFLSGGLTGSVASSMNNTPEAKAQAQQALVYEQTQKFAAQVQSIGLAPDSLQGVVGAYTAALQSGDKQAAAKLQSTAKSTAAKIAEINAGVEITQAEVLTSLRPTFEAMQQAQQAGDIKAFLSAQSKYKADFDVGIAKNKAAKLKAENAMSAARDVLAESAGAITEKARAAEAERQAQTQRQQAEEAAVQRSYGQVAQAVQNVTRKQPLGPASIGELSERIRAAQRYAKADVNTLYEAMLTALENEGQDSPAFQRASEQYWAAQEAEKYIQEQYRLAEPMLYDNMIATLENEGKDSEAFLKASGAYEFARARAAGKSLQLPTGQGIIQAEQERGLQDGTEGQFLPRDAAVSEGNVQNRSVETVTPGSAEAYSARSSNSGIQAGAPGSEARGAGPQAENAWAFAGRNDRAGTSAVRNSGATVAWGTPFNERARQSLRRHVETAQRETRRAVVIREVTEIPSHLAEAFQFIKNIAGINSPDVFLYESDDSFGDGWKDENGIFIRVNGGAHPAFVYGHEVGHTDSAIIAAGMSAIDKLTREQLDAYGEYRNAHISSPDNADIRRELVADMYGRYLHDATVKAPAEEMYGLDADAIGRFYDAFEQALGAQSGTGETEGEIVDVVSTYAATGDPEYSRATPVSFPEKRWKGEKIQAIEIDVDPQYEGKPLYPSLNIEDMMRQATFYVTQVGMRNKSVTVQELDMPVLLDYQQGLKKLIRQPHGGAENKRILLRILPKFEQILQTAKFYGTADSTKQGSPGAEFTYLVNLVKDGEAFYAVRTTLKLPQGEAIDRFHGYEISEIGITKVNSHSPSDGMNPLNPIDAELTALGGAKRVYNISIFDLFSSVKLGPFAKDIKTPEWVEYSRITFKDEYGITHSLNMPEIKARSDGTFHADFTLNGERKRMEGKDKAELEQRVREVKEKQRLQTLSRSVRNLRKASDLFSRGVTSTQYYKQAGDNYDYGVARLLRGLYLRNGFAQGGALSEQEMLTILANADKWKDKGAVSYGRETFTRNLEDIASTPEEGRRLVDIYATPIRENVAAMTKWMKGWAERIAALKLNTEESAMVQLLGEGRVTPDVLAGGLKFEDGKPMDTAKIKNAVETFRTFYNEALELANQALIRNGYEPIHARKNYFPHIGEEVGDFQGFINKVIKGEEDLLPTAISGQTDIFIPGKPWFKNFQARYGEATDYDALRGFNKYMNGVGRVIFLTDSIQRIRQFEAAIRGKYSTGDKDSELKGKERAQHMSNFAAELLEYGNQLAGKKSRIDRAIEQAFGRPIFAKLDWLKKRFGANAIGGNLSPALTNFIPLTHALATLKKGDFARGLQAAMSRQVRMDGLWETSNFLMSRFGKPDEIVTKPWEKFKQGAFRTTNYLFEMVDRFTAETLVFAKYQEGLRQGLTEDAAMRAADEYAERTMGGRTIGAVPTLMNSKTLGFFTQFQLEVNNQMSAMFKDIPRSYGGDKRKFLKALVQLFIYSWLYNELMEKVVTGRRPAFDPIGVIVEAVEDYSTGKAGDATIDLATNILDQLPFGQLLTGGGRVPLASALEGANPTDAIKKTLNGENAGEAWGKFAEGILYNFVPPAGGGQIRKTVGGLRDYAQGGRYYGDKLAYSIEQDGANFMSAILFGSAATKEGRTFYQGDAKALSAAQTEKYGEMVKQGMDPQQAYDFLKDADTKTNAGTLASIVTFDADGDGQPDMAPEEMNMVAAALGIEMPKGKTVAQQARAEADSYIKRKRDDKELTPAKRQEAEDYYADLMRRLLN